MHPHLFRLPLEVIFPVAVLEIVGLLLDPSSTVGALLRPGNPQKSAVFDSTWSKT